MDNLLLDNNVDLLSIFDNDKQLLSIKKKKSNHELIDLIDNN